MLKRTNKEGKKGSEGQEEWDSRVWEESAKVWGGEGAGRACWVGTRQKGPSAVFTSNQGGFQRSNCASLTIVKPLTIVKLLPTVGGGGKSFI